MPIKKPVHGHILLYQKEKQKIVTRTRLPTCKQIDNQEPVPATVNTTTNWLIKGMHPFH